MANIPQIAVQALTECFSSPMELTPHTQVSKVKITALQHYSITALQHYSITALQYYSITQPHQ
jgi:hypothetical protein